MDCFTISLAGSQMTPASWGALHPVIDLWCAAVAIYLIIYYYYYVYIQKKTARKLFLKCSNSPHT